MVVEPELSFTIRLQGFDRVSIRILTLARGLLIRSLRYEFSVEALIVDVAKAYIIPRLGRKLVEHRSSWTYPSLLPAFSIHLPWVRPLSEVHAQASAIAVGKIELERACFREVGTTKMRFAAKGLKRR
jgi:hypothetical protein